MPLHVSGWCAHHHTYRCGDTRGCVMQFWPPDDEHMSSKHIQAWDKLIVKQKFCASSWLITEIIMLRYTVSKTSKKLYMSGTVSLSVIRSFSLYTQQWYMSYRFADSLRKGSGWNQLASCQKTCMTHTIAGCTVKKLLMMDTGTVQNMWSFIPKINLRNQCI